MTETRPHLRIVTIGGLLAGAVGIGIAKAGGMDMPPVPPGAVLLVVAAALLAVFRTRRWPAYVALLVGLAEAVPSAVSLGGADGGGQIVGSAVRFAGALVAVAGSALLAVPTRSRSRA